jgi:hypothetical protein
MQQVKIFKSIESELVTIEKEINQWIASSNAKIISITGNIAAQTGKGSHVGAFSASDVLVIILYEAT